MSVLINGMEMPTSCRYCEFRHLSLTQNAFCTAAQETIDYMAERTKRLDNCPLVELPPHGRLIDADALKASLAFAEKTAEWAVPALRAVLTVIDEMPTIIKAEEGKA